MANAYRGEYRVTLRDGDEEKEFTLVFDYGAMCAYEDRTDSPAADLSSRLEQGRLSAVRNGLWAGLVRKHPKITQARVSDMIIADRLDEYTVAILKGFSVVLLRMDPKDVEERFRKALAGDKADAKPAEVASPGKVLSA